MNKLATFLLISVIATVLIGCSSGSSTSEAPQGVSGIYQGMFTNTDDDQNGMATFNLAQVENSNTITGNATFDRDGGNTCLISGVVSNGLVTGFSVALTVSNVNFQLNLGENGSVLNGTYVLTTPIPDQCGSSTGSGNITLTRN